jgi:hypothetical protein
MAPEGACAAACNGSRAICSMPPFWPGRRLTM